MNPVRRYPETAAGPPYPGAGTAPPPARAGRTGAGRSAFSLVVLALVLGLALAVSLGVVIWLISVALHAAATA